MLIRDWMTKDVITVEENTSLMRATRLMKDNNIRRLPVVFRGKITGILTDRDVKDASPSKSSSLDVHELYYLLSDMKVKELMTSSPLTMCEDESLEKAAMIMVENKISGMPITDKSDHLSGLLSESDVLRGFIHVTGIVNGALLYVFDVPDQDGATTGIVQFFKDKKSRIISVLTSFDDADESTKRVAIRIFPEKDSDILQLTKSLKENHNLVYYCTDELTNMPHK